MSDTSSFGLQLGIAAIAAAYGKTMQQRDPEFGLDFVKNLEAAYRLLRDATDPSTEAMEIVKWTGQLMEQL